MMINTLVRMVTLLVIVALNHVTTVIAQEPVVPDFTKGAKIPKGAKHDWNLGPTGLRGWIYSDMLVTTDARQILVTGVDAGSPAAETFRIGDVILGAGGKPFSFDPRTELGKAITTAESKAGGGKLMLTRWRAGNSEEVVLDLPVLGSYGATAPFDCEKSIVLLEEGCKALAARMSQPDYTRMDAIPRSLNALALLASGNPEYMPLLKTESQWAARYSNKSMQTWYYGYCMLFLSEYVLATGDESVLPGLKRLALEAAKGQSAVGSWGHGFAIPDGRLGGYGMMNSPGVVLTISLVLAREAGVKDVVVDEAIERSAKLLRFYIGKGSIPYGDHSPWMEGHEDNGKCGMAAILFNSLGEVKGAEFFSRMSVAAHGAERDCGHCGNYFNMLWAMPSVALSGPNSTGAWMKEFGAWYFDLARRWDGSYPHQGPPEKENDSFEGFDATGTYLLAYAMPLKKTRLTGAGRSVVPSFGTVAADALIADGRGWDNKDRTSAYDALTFDQLVERLGSWSPIVRERAAMALGRRQRVPVSAIVKLLDAPSLDTRYGACQALSKLGQQAESAVEPLQRCLNAEDLWLRVSAAEALAKIGPAAKPAVPKLLDLLAEVDKVNDPRGMQQRYLTFALFEGDGMLGGSLDGVDRDALYKAVRAGLKNQDGRARGSLSSVYRNLSAREIKPLLPAIYQAITEPAPSGEMFADGIRVEGLRLFAKHRIEEGIQACIQYTRQQNPWASELRTPELMEVLLSYGTHAKVVVPELTELANYFENDEPNFPKELMKQKAQCVRDTIRAIEASTEKPELIRINITPEAKQPIEKESTENELSGAADKTPLKVFILAGQSNMQGHASISTFDALIPHVENWIQWRGPTADGRAGDRAQPPIQWDRSTNIAWEVDLLGQGSATPIVFGKQIFVLSAFKTERKSPQPVVNSEQAKTTPDEFFYQFVVSSYDRSSGKLLWQQVAVDEVPHEGKHDTNTYAAGSPITDGERLYFSFGSRGVFCYSLDGEPIWNIDLGDMRTRNGWGEAVTPALTDDSVIINWDQEEGSFIAAIDKLSGQIRWKKDRAGEVTSWNTPFVTTFEDKQQIIVNGTGSVKSYDAKDGSVLWECGGQTVNAIPSPIRFHDSVICMSGYRGSLACSVPLNSRGNITDDGKIDWKITRGTPYVPSPILSGTRLLFTAGNTNALSCMDAETGQPLLERMRLDAIRSMYASPILASGHFYFTSRDGTTVVLKDNASLDVVAVNSLDDVIDASPVAVDDQLFLRSWNKLYCIENTPTAKPRPTSKKNKEQPAAPLSFKQVNLEETSETSANASVGDVDGDGDLDIVLAKGRHWPLSNQILLNDGQGNFETKDLGSQPDRSYTALLGDIDNDGDLDIVVSNDKPDDKAIYKNDGKGNFTLASTWGDPSWNTRNITLADLNRDGFCDLVVANRKSNSYIILNDGAGNFLKENWILIPSESTTTIVAGDFDRDGFIDLAVPHRDGGASRILFNDEELSFQRTTTFGPDIASTRACAAGDLNGDGAIDLILGDDRLGTCICINDGKGNFPDKVTIGDPKLAAYSIATGFLNQDDRLDLIVGYANGGSRVFLNDGAGTKFQELPFGEEKGAVYGIAVGDFNADDCLDIVQARSNAPNTLFFCSQSNKPEQLDRETRNILGWQVHIARKLLETEPDDTAKALAGLEKMLDEIVRVVPAAAVAEMKKVPLYFSPSYQPGRSGAEFHPGAGWLRDNGRDPAMAQGVEFSGVHNFEAEMRRMPNFALHELAHAFHFRALPDGFGNAEIKAAFERAKRGGLYDRVERSLGNDKPNTFERAYAMTNAMEYFAETTEAYFSRNDFFPFTREELLKHDPEMHVLLEKLWGVPDAKWLSFTGGEGPGKGNHVVLIAAEQEYRSEQSMPMMAKILATHHGFDCTVLFGVNESGEVDPTLPVYPEKGKEAEFKEHHIPGLEQLASADLVIFCTRLLTLPKSELTQIVEYVDSGKPIIALRTANHGFRGPLPYKIDGKQVRWGEDVLGGTFLNHHGRWQADSTRGFFDKNQTQHPILIGVNDIWGDSDVYRTYAEGSSLPADCTALVWGQPLMGRKPDDMPNDKLEPLPVAWVKPWRTSNGNTAKVFHCTMGSASDFKNQGLRRLVVNAAYWCVGLEASISATRSVDVVGSYEPLKSGFNYEGLGVKPRPVTFYK